MSLLEEVKQFSGRDIREQGCRCFFCGERIAPKEDTCFHGGVHRHGEHHPDCPWLILPKILTALEAAERYVSLNGRDDVSMTDIMHAEDDLHEAFGHARRYDVEEITP